MEVCPQGIRVRIYCNLKLLVTFYLLTATSPTAKLEILAGHGSLQNTLWAFSGYLAALHHSLVILQ
jgi:hypothetical protein